MARFKKADLIMTEGKILPKMIVYVLPLIAVGLLQTFYNVADTIIVGLSEEADAVGAVGTTGAFINLMLNLCVGFAVGANVIVSHRIGAGDHERASKAVHTSICMSFLFGILSGVLGIAFARLVFTWQGLMGKTLDLAVEYTVIYFVAVPLISFANTANAIFRSKGDTVTPLVVFGIAGALNVLLNLLFVLVFKMTVDGVSIATVLSNVFATVTLLIILSKDNTDCRFSLKLLKMDKKEFMAILKISLPSCIQGIMMNLSNLLLQSAIMQVSNSVTSPDADFQPVLKGYASSVSLEGFLYSGTNAVMLATVSFVGQNYGAKKFDRIKRIRRVGSLLTIVVALALGGILYFGKDLFLFLYGITPSEAGSLQEIAYQTAVIRMGYAYLPYFIGALAETYAGVLRALGKSTSAAVLTFTFYCVFKVIWILFVFPQAPKLETIYISYLISWTATAITAYVYGLIVYGKLKRKNQEELQGQTCEE